MNWSYVAEVEELSETEFTHHADNAGISTSEFSTPGFIFNLKSNAHFGFKCQNRYRSGSEYILSTAQ